ncbi:signal peptidase I [Lottiidibacillus patelloidae]|uniref:Signal peptidase I n=1 Tax=Lottiidibacillus patelloidae TaxID=2670334 RepID=A0A263BXU0_9BACI|nr:signal peptidase I [Lottiidibacillus patelloidae]OZM58581.1 signal peptidase I [Lottiidibacillus patelloidae]
MPRKKNELWEWTKALMIALALAGIIRYLLFAPIVVDGDSMLPTLQDNNRMIVNKVVYSISDVNRFDIVVFHATENKDYIKRVIALPGETIKYENDKLYINGELVEEPFLQEIRLENPERYTTYIEEMKVPEGHVYVLGDNRNHSRDSRHIGPISVEEIIGEANIVFWPFAEFRYIK